VTPAEMLLKGSRFEPGGSDRARHATTASNDAAPPLRWMAEMNHILKKACTTALVGLQNCLSFAHASLLERSSYCFMRYSALSVVSLDECLEKLATSDRSRRYAVLSFDDGYRDNVSVALPVLERHNAPFMMYVPTGAYTIHADVVVGFT
jgi:hypothetical protein